MVLTAGGTMNVSLTVDTGNPLLAGTQAKLDAPKDLSGGGQKLALACFLPGGLLLGFVGLRLRKVRGVGGLLLILVLAGISAVLTGCGTVNQIGTPAGIYNFNVSATGKTGVSQTLPITMTVTQ